MNRAAEYPSSWSVFLIGKGMNVVNLFSGNHSQGYQGMVGPAAQSQAQALGQNSSQSVPRPGPRSSQVAATATLLPTSQCIGASCPQVSNCDSINYYN